MSQQYNEQTDLPTPMAASGRYSVLISFLIFALLAWYLKTKVNVDQLLSTLYRADIGHLFLGIGLTFVGRILLSKQFTIFAHYFHVQLSSRFVFCWQLGVTFYSGLFPSYVAAVVGWQRINSRILDGWKSLFLIIVSRLLLTLFPLLLALMVPIAVSKIPWVDGYIAVAPFLRVGVMVLLVLLFFLGLNIKAIPVNRWTSFSVLKHVVSSLNFVLKMPFKDRISIIIFGFVVALLPPIIMYIMILSCGGQIPLHLCVFFAGVLNLLILLPVPLPNLGVREASFVIVLSAYQVPAEIALAASLLLYFINLVECVVGGILELPFLRKYWL